MLTEKIMHECIFQLLAGSPPAQEDIYALCTLLTAIGKQLDHPQAKNYMDKFFSRMENLSNDKKLPGCIRFMIQDVITLRRHRWRDRRKQQSVHKEDWDRPPEGISSPSLICRSPSPRFV